MADFGPWARVTDANSAHQVVQMAGRPVFMIGLLSVLFATLTLLTVMSSGLTINWPFPVALLLVVGLALVALCLALRAGRSAMAPIAALLILENAAMSRAMLPLWLRPLQATMVLVAVSGLRGWWWLRKHAA